MSELFLGVDLGTSGLKACAVSGDGSVMAQAEASYAVQRPVPGHAEIAPRTWQDALRAALDQLGDVRFTSVGIVGQMHGLVVIDEGGQPCRPAILWPDRRATAEVAAWQRLSNDQRRRLGNPLTPGMAGPMLAWLQRHEPGALARARFALQPKDYLRGTLGGRPLAERSDASATLLWDVPADGWARDVVQQIGLPSSLLPEVVASGQVVGEAALPGDPALVAGAGDTPAALLGAGGLEPGDVQINLGTGAQILKGVAEPEPVADPVTHLYADADSSWYAMVGIQNAGLALNKVRQWLGLDWTAFFAEATAAPPGAGGVSIIPYLAGERGGVAAPDSRGAWLGLSDTTTVAHIARAAVEGMVFAVRQGMDLLGAADAVRVSGGGVRQALVVQMLADVLRATVSVVPERSASAMGAAMLAARGVGAALPVTGPQPVVFEPQPAPALEESFHLWLTRVGASADVTKLRP